MSITWLPLSHRKNISQIKIVCVAIDSDARVQQLKGYPRPINNCFKRVEMLEALRYVDYAVVFHSDAELRQIILEWQPDFMVKGADYIGKPIVGEDLVKKIVYVDLTEDSTTKIIQSISNR